MADFDKYAPKLQRLEGGFVDDPADRGGATMCGVTFGTYRMVFGESKSIEDLKNISYAEWRYIMKSEYWDCIKADDIRNQSIAELLSDWCVNSGKSVIKKIQKIVGVAADGIVGPKTLAAINNANQLGLFTRVRTARLEHYENIVKKNPSQAKFLRGWMNRLNSFTFSE